MLFELPFENKEMLFELPFEGLSCFLSHYDLWDVIPHRHSAHEQRFFAVVSPCRLSAEWLFSKSEGKTPFLCPYPYSNFRMPFFM